MAGAAIPRYQPLRTIGHRVEFLIDLLRAEFAPHRRRIRNTIRMALVGTVGAGLMAACHVQSVLGTYVIWTLVGAAAPMMNFGQAVGYTIAAAALMALSVPLAGILAETPWLLLPFVGLMMTALSYVVTTSRFGSSGLVLKVVVLDTFYEVVFHPNTFAEATAATFGGTALSFGLLALFDMWLWPNPAEPILLEALSDTLERIRARMQSVADAFLDPRPGRIPPLPPPLSALARHLDLLDRVASEGAMAFRHGVLLAAISRTERLHAEIDRMTIIAREDTPRELRGMMHRPLSDAIDAISGALDEFAQMIPHEIPTGPDLPPPPAASRVKPAMDSLDTATTAARPTYLERCSSEEIVNFAAFVASLWRMADLLGRRLDHPHVSDIKAREEKWWQVPPYDQHLARYSIKVGLATILGYCVGVISHHEELSVILTTILIAGLPTYGATVHKMILRLAGNLVGGILALLAIILITPNFETVPVYMLTFAIVFLIAGYAGLSSGRVAYAGKQIGTAFTLAFAGISPSEAIDSPLYRVWGIILGVVVVGSVFFTIWPEYASASMLPRLRKALRDTIDLIPGTAVSKAQAKIDVVSNEITHTLFDLLNIVDDAQLEGARSRIEPSAVVDACSTLRRIAHRFGRIDAERIRHPLPPLSAESGALYATFTNAMCDRLQNWQDLFAGEDALKVRAAMRVATGHPADELITPLRELNDRVSANQFAEVASWTIEERRILLAELQSFHRVTELSAELDQHLAQVPRS